MKATVFGLCVPVMIVLASACGISGGSSGPGVEGGGATDPGRVTAAPLAESDALAADRDACVRARRQADPGVDRLLSDAEAAGGSHRLGVEEHVATTMVLTECTPEPLLALQLAEVDQPWVGPDELNCLVTFIKGHEAQGLAYLGLLHLLSGRLEAPAFAAAAQDPAIVGATSCVSPIRVITDSMVDDLLADPATAGAVDHACYERNFAEVSERVGFWLQRYLRVVYRQPDNEDTMMAIEGNALRCIRTGTLYQATVLRDRNLAIGDDVADCITQRLAGTDYVRHRVLETPEADALLTAAAQACIDGTG